MKIKKSTSGFTHISEIINSPEFLKRIFPNVDLSKIYQAFNKNNNMNYSTQMEKHQIDVERKKLGTASTNLFIRLRKYWKEIGEENLDPDELVDSIDESILLKEIIIKFASDSDWKCIKDFLGEEEFEKHFEL